MKLKGYSRVEVDDFSTSKAISVSFFRHDKILRYLFAFIVGMIANNGIGAQVNLVPNPSFETYTISPCNFFPNYPTINFAPPWKSLWGGTDLPYSVDYFNGDSCNFMVPINMIGSQTPRTGNSYMGFITNEIAIQGPSYKYIESFYVSLDSTLNPENNYELCIYLSLPESYCMNRRKLSFSITADTLTKPQLSNLSNSDIFYLEGLDQCNYSDWTQICATFSPLQIGNILTFNVIDDQSLIIADTVLYNNGECEHPLEIVGTYYYIDDVSLVNKGKNTGMPLNGSQNSLAVYPNPTNGLINLSFDKPVNGKISVNNLMGQILVNESVSGESITLDLSNFSSGIYFVNFIDEAGKDVRSFKVLKQ